MFIKSFLATLTAIFITLSGVSTAHAHADLTSSNPEDGSSLSEAPSVIELTFNEQLLPDTVEIAVTTESAGLIPNLAFSTDGSMVSLPWDQGLPGDTYQVAYRVVSNDGHPITGAISFSYSTPMISDASEPDASEPDASEPEPSATPEVTAAEAEESVTQETSGISPVWIALGGLLIGAAIGYLMWRRGTKRTDN